MWKKILVLGIIVTALVIILWPEPEIRHGPGVKAPNSPEQEKVKDAKTISIGNYRLKPVARFIVEARVLSRERYYLGRESDLAPVDLALGWGDMSNESVLDRIKISQSGRFFWWKTDQFPIPRKEIERQSGNMHLIPADASVEEAIKSAIKGNIVKFEGYLVNVKAKDGWKWKSSLTRNDTGTGACELVYVESFEILE